MDDEREKATEENIENFLEEFKPLFNTYIDNELPNFLTNKFSRIYWEYDNHEFIKVQFKLENQRMIGKKIGRSSEFLVLNLKQVVGYKKGIFKSMINFIETVCQEKKINLHVSQILNPILTNNLEINGYKILKEEWDTDVNAVKIFDNLGNGDGKKKKSKKRSKKKKRSRKI